MSVAVDDAALKILPKRSLKPTLGVLGIVSVFSMLGLFQKKKIEVEIKSPKLLVFVLYCSSYDACIGNSVFLTSDFAISIKTESTLWPNQKKIFRLVKKAIRRTSAQTCF